MAQPHRALRADAARNRGRILEVAYETFAAEGVAAPIDEIARRAGVGAGTVYRNFPTKEALFTAVFEDRIATMLERARALLATDPTDALFVFLREMIEVGATDQGLVDALAGDGIDVFSAAPKLETDFLGVLADLLAAAQRAGTDRPDVDVRQVKALLAISKSAQGYDADVMAGVATVILDGLRASR